MFPDSVAELSSSCVNEFDAYLAQPCLDLEVSEQQRYARRYKERLVKWINDSSVHGQWQQSLDFLLRDRHDLRSLLVRILKTILKNARKVNEEMREPDGPSDHTQTGSPMSSDSWNTKRSRYSTLTVMATNLRAIKKHLARLEELHSDVQELLGRQPADLKSSLDEDFQRFATVVVEHYNPRVLTDPLQKRLVSTMCQTRSRLLHMRRRNTEHNQRAKLGESTDINPVTTKSYSSLTEAKLLRHLLETYEGTETTTTYRTFRRSPRDLGPIDWPEPPISNNAVVLECPYCGAILENTYQGHSKWRQHLVRDIRPYVCLLDNCHRLEPFKNRKEWIQHLEQHSLSWYCESTTHAPVVHTTIEDAAAHLQDFHKGAFSESETSLLLRNTAYPDLESVVNDCPFCEKDSEFEFEPISYRLSHIVNHVIRFLLKALPSGTEEFSSSGIISSYADTIFLTDPSEFFELDRLEDDPALLQPVSSPVLSESDLPLLEEPEDWTYVLGDSRPAQETAHPEEDPVLTSFARGLRVAAENS